MSRGFFNHILLIDMSCRLPSFPPQPLLIGPDERNTLGMMIDDEENFKNLGDVADLSTLPKHTSSFLKYLQHLLYHAV